MKKLQWIFLIIFFLLSGCSTLTPKKTELNNQQWVLNGAVAVHTQKTGGSASIYWKQAGDDYALRIFGPLGLGAVQLYGQPGDVELVDAKGDIYRARSAESLLQKTLGWQIPVSNLVYWIRGIPAPHFRAKAQFDDQHRLSQLEQQGWQINYLSYMDLSADALPHLLALSRGDLKIRIVIESWAKSN